MKKVLVIALAICLAFAGVALAGVAGSYHDLGTGGQNLGSTGTGQACVFCHHPHRGDATALGLTGNLLWNITGWEATPFPVYDSAVSSTLNATTSDLQSSGSGYTSYLCMACHDGVIGNNALVRPPRDGTNTSGSPSITGAANLGVTLEDDHPINFDYASVAAVDTEIVANPSSTALSATYPLFNGTMQCATCHDVHRGSLTGVCSTTAGVSCDSDIEFMLGDTTGSEICTDCHLK